MLPLLGVPNSLSWSQVATGSSTPARQHYWEAVAAAGSPVPPPGQGAAHTALPLLPCPALPAAIYPSPGDGDIPFLAPGKRRLSGKVEQSSAVTHVPAVTGGREPGTSRAGGTGGTGERRRHSGCSGRFRLSRTGAIPAGLGSHHRGHPGRARLSSPGPSRRGSALPLPGAQT